MEDEAEWGAAEWATKLALVAAVAVGWRFLRQRPPPKPGPVRITSPSVLFLDLTGGRFQGQAQADQAALSPFFARHGTAVAEGQGADVVFAYFDEALLSQRDLTPELDALAARLGAKVLVSAAANTLAHAGTVLKPNPQPGLQRVWVLARRDDLFHAFFTTLFTQMKQGISMPVAWAKLTEPGPTAPPPELKMGYAIGGQLAFA